MKLSTTVPALPVQNVREAVAFYQRRLGFSVSYADDRFARLIRDEAAVHLCLGHQGVRGA